MPPFSGGRTCHSVRLVWVPSMPFLLFLLPPSSRHPLPLLHVNLRLNFISLTLTFRLLIHQPLPLVGYFHHTLLARSNQLTLLCSFLARVPRSASGSLRVWNLEPACPA